MGGVRVIVAVTLFAVVAAIGGAFVSPLAVLAPFAALLCGLAFGAVLAAVTSSVEGDEWLAAIFRFGLVPLFLFSGTFFPIEQLPALARAAGVGDAALARRRALPQPCDGRRRPAADGRPRRLPRRR